jgi:hypothetical protein
MKGEASMKHDISQHGPTVNSTQLDGRLPQTGEGLHGEQLGTDAWTTDVEGPNTPESNLPEPEYSEGDAAGLSETAITAPRSPLERLPESVSLSELTRQGEKYGRGGY